MADPRRRPRILVADDEPEWLALLGTWLEADYDLARASCGADVLRLAEADPPDCFILDYDLGDAKGSELCARIRAHPRLGRIPVIILTALAGKMLDAVAEGGPDHFVVKSPHPDELRLVLGDILPGRPPA